MGLSLPNPIRRDFRFPPLAALAALWLAALFPASLSAANCSYAAQLEAARQNYRPVDSLRLQRSRDSLSTALGALSRRLNASGSQRARDWYHYLQWREMTAELAKGAAGAPSRLEAILARYYQPYAGLELAEFREVRTRLRKYAALLRHFQQSDGEPIFRERLNALARRLAGRSPTSLQGEDWLVVSEIHGWLADTGLAPSLTACLRRDFGQGNLRFKIAKAALPTAALKPIRRITPVTEFSFGAQVRGTAFTEALPQIRFVPNSTTADVRIVLQGHTSTRTTGYRGPVAVQTLLETDFEAAQRLGFGAGKFYSYAPHVTPRTWGRIGGLQANLGLGRRIVEHFGWKRAQQFLPAAKRKASQRVAQQVGADLNRQVGTILQKANQYVAEFISGPFQRVGFRGGQFFSQTTADALYGTLRIAREDQLSAPGGPPAGYAHGDIAGAVHESYFANAMGTSLGGTRLTSREAAQIARALLGEVPEELTEGPDQGSWDGVFAREAPLLFSFRNQEITLVLRLDAFHWRPLAPERLREASLREPASGPLRVEVKYRPRIHGGLVLERVGDIAITSGREMSAELAGFVQRKFNALLGPVLRIADAKLPALFASDGKHRFRFRHVSAREGWLSVGGALTR